MDLLYFRFRLCQSLYFNRLQKSSSPWDVTWDFQQGNVLIMVRQKASVCPMAIKSLFQAAITIIIIIIIIICPKIKLKCLCLTCAAPELNIPLPNGHVCTWLPSGGCTKQFLQLKPVPPVLPCWLLYLASVSPRLRGENKVSTQSTEAKRFLGAFLH